MSEVRCQKSEIRGQRSGVRMRRFGVPWLFCLLSSVVWCLAFLSNPLAMAEQLKMGYVDLGRVFDGYQRTKESDQVLEQTSKQKQTELEGRVNELKKLRQNLDLLNDQAKEAKAKEIEEKSDEFQRLKTRTERELVRQRNQFAKEILDEIQQTVTEYAKANGFSLVLDQRALLYGQDLYDVTDDVLKLLNSRYATKASKSDKR